MLVKEHSAFSKALVLTPNNQMQFSIILKTPLFAAVLAFWRSYSELIVSPDNRAN